MTLQRLSEVEYPVLYSSSGNSCHIPCLDEGRVTGICYTDPDNWGYASLANYIRRRDASFCLRCRHVLKKGRLDVEKHLVDVESLLSKIEQSGIENSDLSGVEISEVV